MMRDGVTASRFKDLQEPECIIVAPTRELINQIYLEARKFSFGYVHLECHSFFKECLFILRVGGQ